MAYEPSLDIVFRIERNTLCLHRIIRKILHKIIGKKN